MREKQKYRKISQEEGCKLEFLHTMWQKTGNPIFVWEAISICQTYTLTEAELLKRVKKNPLPIPEWCCDYLGMVAIGIRNLANRPDIQAGERAKKTANVLRLIAKGKNAYKAYDVMGENLWLEALHSVSKNCLKKEAIAIEEELCGVMNISENSTIRKRLSSARKSIKVRRDIALRLTSSEKPTP